MDLIVIIGLCFDWCLGQQQSFSSLSIPAFLGQPHQ
jgi:hypothetical protein